MKGFSAKRRAIIEAAAKHERGLVTLWHNQGFEARRTKKAVAAIPKRRTDAMRARARTGR